MSNSNFDPIQHQLKQKPQVDKLLAQLSAKGISFSKDPDHDNVILSSADKVVKISSHSFYRYSGIACIYREKNENQIETVTVTDEMYLQMFMKPIIENFFK